MAFTDNIRDLSNENGFQFEFVCERCGNGYRSPYVNNLAERGRGLLRGAGSLFGGKLEQLSHASMQLAYDRGTNSKSKDRAMAEAVEAVRDQFKQCRGCGNWVCVPVCWNHDIGQCLVCSPSVAEEISRAQAAAQVEQIHEKVRQTDWTADLDLTTRAKVTCPNCSAKIDGGKFCPECGGKLSASTFCTECGSEMAAGAKFCGECGHSAGA
ncbi:MAG: zinc ribbon domain-containing protein [Actinobacteria bacterium 69-20]|nr:zinc ribbon domain-containing protein [Actinomycetota bacterium]OJV23658.1 MAG: zinc ribbon domain-containing protein [Actinobacteria bacterium 69-20]